jgi:hypothetical protein
MFYIPSLAGSNRASLEKGADVLPFPKLLEQIDREKIGVRSSI